MILSDSWEISLDGEFAHRKAFTYTDQSTQKKKQQAHAPVRTHDPSTLGSADGKSLRPPRLLSSTGTSLLKIFDRATK